MSQNIEEKKKKLHEELGRLSYEITVMREEQNEKAKRANEIGEELKKLNG